MTIQILLDSEDLVSQDEPISTTLLYTTHEEFSDGTMHM